MRKLIYVAGILAASIAAVHAEFPIHDGDRVVFLGDSITEQRLYTTYIEAYVLSRHPDWKLSFRNVGWGGDTAWLRQRAHPDENKLYAAGEAEQQAMVEDSVGRGLARDVLPLKPTFVTVKFGMNDHSYQAFRPDIFRAYSRSQTQISKVLQQNGARVAFLTPQPIEDRRPDPDQDIRNQSLRKFSDGLREVAGRTGALFVDQFAPYMSLMLSARANEPKVVIGGGDAVHPGPSGQTLMAWAILKGLGAEALVSRATIDTGRRKSETESCKISQLMVEKDNVRFDRLDACLPLPVDDRAESAIKLAPVLNDLGRYELRVTGLSEGTYEMTVDGESIGRYSSAALDQGVNLPSMSGPLAKQSKELLGLIFEKNNLFFERWRGVQLYNPPGWLAGNELESRRTAEISRLDGEIARREARIDAVRKPVVHHFELKPANP